MPGATVYEFTPYRLVPAQRQLVRDGTPVKLGGRAFDVLVALVERRERTVSKNELMDLVWPTVVVEENNLEVQIVTLRKLLGYAAIATIPGRGYRFTLPVAVEGVPLSEQPPAREGPTPAHTHVRVSAPVLYGREEDLRSLNRMLAEYPVVTVTGAGGIGKTRLAQLVAREFGCQDPAAVHWVELATLADPAMVPFAVARVLGISLDNAGDPNQTLIAALRDRSALLVLDNAEHLLDGVAALVSRVRKDATSVRLLITSQEVLRTLDEQVFRLAPLSLPEDDATLEEARKSGAVQLFVARAHAADPHFELFEQNCAAVVDICRRLDGIPLAIELAAARVPLLNVHGVRQRLDERFSVLTAGKRAVLRRHQTLRAALEWSHGLLTVPEQVVFRRLGVFAAGFTMEAAQNVLHDDAIDGWDALEHMGALVDKSLLVAEGDPVPRYRMLETTRLYALERLADAAETDSLLLRHARYYCDLIEAQARMLSGAAALAPYLAVLDPERDNFLHALSWCARDPTDDVARVALQLVVGLRYFWSARAMVSVGLQLTIAALKKAEHLAPDALRCLALGTAATLHLQLGENEPALAVALEHVNLARQLQDHFALADALTRGGLAAAALGREDEARNHLTSALEEARAIDHVQLQCHALSALVRLDYVAGRIAQAAAQADAVVDLGRKVPSPQQMALWLLNAAEARLSLGQVERAREYLQEAATLYPQTDSRMTGQFLIHHAATLSALDANWTLSVQLLGAADALQQVSGIIAWAGTLQRHLREHDLARVALGLGSYEQALLEGRRMTYGDAVQLAHKVLGSPASP